MSTFVKFIRKPHPDFENHFKILASNCTLNAHLAQATVDFFYDNIWDKSETQYHFKEKEDMRRYLTNMFSQESIKDVRRKILDWHTEFSCPFKTMNGDIECGGAFLKIEDFPEGTTEIFIYQSC